jgi:hypothetical protein
MLLAGVDALIVSTWLGHKDVSTLAKVYQHLQQRPEFLHEKLRMANDTQKPIAAIAAKAATARATGSFLLKADSG